MFQDKQAGSPDDRWQQEASCSPVVDYKVTWMRVLEPEPAARDHYEHEIGVDIVVGTSGHHAGRPVFRALEI
jgi:hypothetical protein